MSITYSQIKDLTFRSFWQNTWTERYNDQDVVIAINAAWLELCAGSSMSWLTWSFAKTLLAEWTTFDFWYRIKRIDEVRWFKTWITSWDDADKLKKVFKTPENELEYQKVWSQVITYDSYLTVKFRWERFLDTLENTELSLWQIFPLWYLEMIIIMEFSLSYLMPVKISEWYNLSQYHRWLAIEMKKTLNNIEAPDTGSKYVKNEII